MSSNPRTLLLAAVLLLPLGCASAREHLPTLPDPSRPAWLALPDAPRVPSWRELPLVARLGFGNGEIHGTVSDGSRQGRAHGTSQVVVYLEPIEGDGSSAASDATATVRQHAQRFSPAFLAVAVGQSVTFTNEDAIFHRVFSYSKPNAFDTDLLARGESGEVRFNEPGEVHFYCSLHPDESGSVFVTPSPWFATVHADGAFRIANVPPGQYQLRAWGEASAPTSRNVTVRPGNAASIDLPLRPR